MNSINNNNKKVVKNKQYTTEQLLSIIMAVVSVMISFFLIPYHEIWRDEAQAWLIARDTPLLDLFKVLKHEGHPVLWYLILMPFAKSGMPVVVMNYISWGFTAAAAVLLVLKSPLRSEMKLLILFSPMLLYWLPVISRSYAPVNFLMMVLAYLYHKRKERPVLYGCIIFLLINFHVITAGIVGAALINCIFDIISDTRKKEKVSGARYKGLAIGIIGCLLMVIQLAGSPGTGNWDISIIFDRELIKDRIIETSKYLFSANVQSQQILLGVILVLVTLVIAVILIASKEWLALMHYIFGSGFVWYILLFVLAAGNKSYMLFSIMIYTLCILQEKGEYKEKLIRFIDIVFGTLLILSGISGYINAIAYDIREDFSNGKHTAELLNEICDNDDVVIFLDNAYESSVTVYLDKNVRVWDITEGDCRSFPLWSTERSANNAVLDYIYMGGLQTDSEKGKQFYSGTGMTDFIQNYADQAFDKGTIVYLVLNQDKYSFFDIEKESDKYDFVEGFYADCRYTQENYQIYRFVSNGIE